MPQYSIIAECSVGMPGMDGTESTGENASISHAVEREQTDIALFFGSLEDSCETLGVLIVEIMIIHWQEPLFFLVGKVSLWKTVIIQEN